MGWLSCGLPMHCFVVEGGEENEGCWSLVGLCGGLGEGVVGELIVGGCECLFVRLLAYAFGMLVTGEKYL